MADTKITALTESTTVVPADLLVIVDDPGGSPITKKVTVENLQADWHIGARVYNSAAIEVARVTWVAITFDSERYDTDAIHDTGSNTERLTCKTAGIYHIHGQFTYDTSAVGYRRRSAIELNGTTYIALNQRPAASSGQTFVQVSTIHQLAVNDYVTLEAYHDATGSIDIAQIGNYSPEFMMQRIG